MRTIEETLSRAEAEALTAVGDVQPNPAGSLIAADREQDTEPVDAVAGSEFVDDRLRLRE